MSHLRSYPVFTEHWRPKGTHTSVILIAFIATTLTKYVLFPIFQLICAFPRCVSVYLPVKSSDRVVGGKITMRPSLRLKSNSFKVMPSSQMTLSPLWRSMESCIRLLTSSLPLGGNLLFWAMLKFLVRHTVVEILISVSFHLNRFFHCKQIAQICRKYCVCSTFQGQVWASPVMGFLNLNTCQSKQFIQTVFM